MMGSKALYEVRDAIAAHLGEDRARELGITVECLMHRDAIFVGRRGSNGFTITAKGLASGSWRSTLAAQLDGIVQAAPEPATASPGSSQEGRDSQDQP